jgi:hypothetical protein
VVATVNQYLADPQSAAPQGSSSSSGATGSGGAVAGAGINAMDTDAVPL